MGPDHQQVKWSLEERKSKLGKDSNRQRTSKSTGKKITTHEERQKVQDFVIQDVKQEQKTGGLLFVGRHTKKMSRGRHPDNDRKANSKKAREKGGIDFKNVKQTTGRTADTPRLRVHLILTGGYHTWEGQVSMVERRKISGDGEPLVTEQLSRSKVNVLEAHSWETQKSGKTVLTVLENRKGMVV